MSDVHGAAPAGGENQASEAPDDGLNDQERAQFAEMERATVGPATDAPAEPAGDAPPAAGAEPAPGADDDDDEGEPAGGAAAAAGAADGRKPRRVSFSKYDRETKELKEALAKANGTIAEKDAMQARLDERLKIINEALTTPPGAEPGAADGGKKPDALPSREDDPEPDPEADIFAHNRWLAREMQRERSDRLQERQQGQQKEQASAADQQLQQNYLDDAESYAAQEPAFPQAYQFLMASRIAELAVHYFGKDLSVEGAKLTREEFGRINRTIVAEEKSIVQGAIASKRSPAAQLFAIAKSRGFRPQAAATGGAAPAGGSQKPTASANPPAAPGALDAPGQQVSVKDEIARVKNGQEAAMSLSGGGGAPPAAIDAVRLANMPQEEFDRFVENTPPDVLRKLMGG